MKNLSTTAKALTVTFLLTLVITISHAQSVSWVKDYYTGNLYHTNSTFTWSGGSRAGYCDGYGKIQFYDSEGNATGWYVGNVQYGKNVGYGTQYLSNGEIFYRGQWVNDEIKDFDVVDNFGKLAGKLLMDKVFDGGINLNTTVIKFINTGGSDDQLKIRVTFNGDIITTNFYAFTMIIDNNAPFVHFENANDNAQFYLSMKVTAAVINAINNANHK